MSAARRLGAGALGLLAAAALVEGGVRAAYRLALLAGSPAPLLYETVYWPAAPWTRHLSILYEDAELGLWTRPGVRRRYVNLFGPIDRLEDVEGLLFGRLPPLALPPWAGRRPVWSLRTNSAGLRDEERPSAKAPGALRVVVLGDSWTVGVNVSEEEAYPRRLERLLRARFPGRLVEVHNYGAIGATAATGARLMRRRVPALEPDLLVVAYAQNDAREFLPPPSAESAGRPGSLARRLGEGSEAWKLLRHRPGAASARFRDVILERLRRPASAEPGACRADPSRSRFARELDAVLDAAAARGAGVVLLRNELAGADPCPLAVLRRAASRRGLALVDSAPLLEAGRARREAAEEARLGLRPGPAALAPRAAAGRARLVFRVLAPDAPGPVFIAGSPPALGGFEPNRVALRDDGRDGDQRAGDGVWSGAFEAPAGSDLAYLYTAGGAPGRWEGLENYVARALHVRARDAGRTVHLPVQRFGERYLLSDPYHPDAEGHALIADALLEPVARSLSAGGLARRAEAGPGVGEAW